MQSHDRAEFALSKSRITAMSGACLGFVALGIGLLGVDKPIGLLPDAFDSRNGARHDPGFAMTWRAVDVKLAAAACAAPTRACLHAVEGVSRQLLL